MTRFSKDSGHCSRVTLYAYHLIRKNVELTIAKKQCIQFAKEDESRTLLQSVMKGFLARKKVREMKLSRSK
jgi:hypothetical protein